MPEELTLRQDKLYHVWPIALRFLPEGTSEAFLHELEKLCPVGLSEEGQAIFQLPDEYSALVAQDRLGGVLTDLLSRALDKKVQVQITYFRYLPQTHQTKRIYPTAMARSALFGIRSNHTDVNEMRPYLFRKHIAAQEGCTITYSGPQLCQADLDVWLHALQLAKERALGHRIRFRQSDFLGAIGRHQKNHAWLQGSLIRLTSSVVEIKMDRRKYVGSLLHEFFQDEDTTEYVLNINPNVAVLFEDQNYSRIDIEQRLKLKQGQVPKWLHAYLLSHRATEEEPHFVSVQKLKDLSGSKTKELKDFRKSLRRGLEVLEDVGFITTFWFKNDVLYAVRATYPKLT